MGRPTKVEGNPLHPASLGATDIFAQAGILGLYDPDRSQTVIHEGRISTWGAFLSQVNDLRNNFAATKGAGLRILTETITSPSLAAQIQAMLKEFPEAKWHQWEPCSRDNVRAGAKLAFGRYANTDLSLRQSGRDSFAGCGFPLFRAGRGAICARFCCAPECAERLANCAAKMNRLYVVEQGSTTTGAMADHRLAIRASEYCVHLRRACCCVASGVEAAGARSCRGRAGGVDRSARARFAESSRRVRDCRGRAAAAGCARIWRTR